MNIKKIVFSTICLMALFVLMVPSFASAQTIVDGDLIRAEGTLDIYIVKLVGIKKFKRLILNPAIFESYGHLKWEDVKDIPQSTLDEHTTSNLVIEVNPDGSVADPKVYTITSPPNSDVGERHHLDVSAAEFEAHGLDWDSLYHVNHTEASPDFYPTKAALKNTDDLLTWATNVNVTIVLQGTSQLSVNGITPNNIISDQTTNVTITGTNFESGATIKIGANASATNVRVVNSTTITATIPAILSAGTYNIIISNPDGKSFTFTNSLTVTAPKSLSISGVTPNQMINSVDNFLTIKGTNFGSDSIVFIGSYQSPSVTFIDSATLSAKISTGTAPGTYSIQVTTGGTSVTLQNTLTIIAPTVTVPTTTELTTAEISAKVSPAVVQIKNDGCSTSGYCAGSGMILDSAGYILTNEHVIKNDDIVEVKLNNGSVVNGTVLGWNEIYDLAVVKISSSNDFVTLGDSNAVALGGKAVALGYPLPNSFPDSMTVSEGIISSKGKTDSYGVSYLQTSAPIQSGSSGGPLVDSEGKVVGINTLCIQLFDLCVEDLRYAIEINIAKSILEDLKSGTQTLMPDLTAPVISNVQATNITMNSATITWITDETSTSKVEYDSISNFGLVQSDTNLVTNHSINLTGLSEDTTYYIKVTSVDQSGNSSSSTVYSFSTNAPVQPPTITTAASTSPAAKSVVTGATEVWMGRMLLTANSEDIKVNSFRTAISDSSSLDSLTTTASANWSNMKIKAVQGSTVLYESGTKSITNAGTGATDYVLFSDMNFTIPKDQTVAVDIYADAIGTSNTWYVGITNSSSQIQGSGVSSGTAVNVSPSSAYVSTAVTIISNGTMTISVDADTPVSQNIAVGTGGVTGVSFSKIKFEAGATEDIKVKKIRITQSGGAILDFAAIKLYDGATQIGVTGYMSGPTVTFTDDTSGLFTLVAGTSKVITVKADLNGTVSAGDSISADTPILYIADVTSTDNYDSVGVSSATDITGIAGTPAPQSTGNYGAMTLYKSVPRVTLNASSPSGTQSPGTGKEMLRFDVSANSLGDVLLESVTLTVSGNANITSTQAPGDAYLYKSTNLTNALAIVSQSGYGTDGVFNPGNTILFANINETIAAGTTKTFVVKGDTTGADSSTGTETIQLSISQISDFSWSDTITTGINTLTTGLPMLGGTLTY